MVSALNYSVSDDQDILVEQGQQRRNALPLQRRSHVVKATIERLSDKTSIVRKDAIRLLCKIVECHPFCIDGKLDIALFKSRISAIDETLEKAAPLHNIIADLRDALPESAQQQLQLENSNNSAPSAQSANNGNEISSEQMEALMRQKRYYTDAIQFTEHVISALPVLMDLLSSKTKSDVVESVQFFVAAHMSRLGESKDGIRKMVHLVWSKDTGDNESKSIRECLIQAYCQLFVMLPIGVEKDRARAVVRNLITLTFNSTLADLTSLEQLLGIMMTRDFIEDAVVQHLWHIYSSVKVDMPIEQRRGAIIVLGMLAKQTPNVLCEHIDDMLNVGLGSFGKADYLLARYTCVALQNLITAATGKGASQDISKRFPYESEMFKKLSGIILRTDNISMDWFSAAEQALGAIYTLSDFPDHIASKIIKTMTRKLFYTKSDLHGDNKEVPPSIYGFKPNVVSFDLAKLFFIVGHVAVKQIVHLELVESEAKRKNSSPAQPLDTKVLSPEACDLAQVVGSVEDELGERLNDVRERELLYDTQALLTMFGPVISHVCSNWKIFESPVVYRMAVLALCKFMTVSENFCRSNLSLLFSILEQTNDSYTRSNIIIAVGDLVACFNNLIDQNISFLYNRLRDSDETVKKNALMVLTHLILNGLVKVKGQISAMALCLEDEDVRVSDLAKLFFTELSTKDNAVYNNLPDILSGLSTGAQTVSESSFHSIMRFLFSFVDKERQAENIVDKLCQRLRNLDIPRHWHDITFCLTLLPFTSEKSFRKLAEGLPLFQDKLHDATVFKHLSDVVAKARKSAKHDTKQQIDDFERKIVEINDQANGLLAVAEDNNQENGVDTLNVNQKSSKDSTSVKQLSRDLGRISLGSTVSAKKSRKTAMSRSKKSTRRKFNHCMSYSLYRNGCG